MTKSNKKFAEATQIVEFLHAVNQAVMKEIGNTTESAVVQSLIGQKAKINTVVRKAVRELLGKSIDLWAEQKEAISKFYKKVFNIDVDWNGIVLPDWTPERSRLELMLSQITGKTMTQAYKKEFGDNAVYENDYSKDIDAKTKSQQQRPDGPYAFAWAGTTEPDAEHLNKTYNEFSVDGNKYMVPREGIMSALRLRVETGNMMDVKGITFFHALDSDQCMLRMSLDGDSQFCLDWYFRDDRHSGCGPRQVNF